MEMNIHLMCKKFNHYIEIKSKICNNIDCLHLEICSRNSYDNCYAEHEIKYCIVSSNTNSKNIQKNYVAAVTLSMQQN